MELLAQLTEWVQANSARAVEWRRYLHAHPELSHHEFQTSSFIARQLKLMGIKVSEQVGGCGVVGEIFSERNDASGFLALRADMDALPITEASGCEYASQHPGIMHACGHDVHMAVVLGAAAVLSKLKSHLPHHIRFIFQPAEEKAPSGAVAMMEAGALKDVVAIFGLHVTPEMSCGTLGFHSGPFMASADEIYLTVKGRGGHAANRPQLINPLLMAAALLPELEKLNHDTKPVLLSFGSMQADGATNVVPDEVTLAGTLRCFDEAVRSDMKKQIRYIADSVAARFGGACIVHMPPGNPVLVNDERLTDLCRQLSSALIGSSNTIAVDRRMGSEDFAHYTHHVPGCFVRLGTGNAEKGISAPLHTPQFDVDESAIAIGMKWMSAVALQRFER